MPGWLVLRLLPAVAARLLAQLVVAPAGRLVWPLALVPLQWAAASTTASVHRQRGWPRRALQ